VTLFHWDLPNYLQQDFMGFLNSSIVDAMSNYADTCFKNFGEYVKYWITFNEPQVFSWLGHGLGTHAPGRCSPPKCSNGSSDTEPYIVAHNILLSHAKIVNLFRTKYKKEGQMIGITLNSDYAIAYNEHDSNDVAAANRFSDFQLGWFLHPILKNDYPISMKTLVGNRLPNFTTNDLVMLNGSIDFLGLNHYTSTYVKNGKSNGTGWISDKNTIDTKVRNGVPLGSVAQSPWLYVYPAGMRSILNFIHNNYGSIEIWITENGVDAPGENNKSDSDAVLDYFRQNYLNLYINELYKAVTIDKINVKAYFIWSLLDNFEWAEGFVSRFGIYHVNYINQNRTLKHSGNWYRSYVVKCKTILTPGMIVLLISIGSVLFILLIGIIGYNVIERRRKLNTYTEVN